MHQRLLMLAALVLLALGNPARAEPACGSDTSADPIAAMGKDVWLNGYCKAFLPCRLVLEQFHACQAAENFLSRLGAKQGQPLTEGQVEDALIQTTGKSSGVEACLWNFDGESCKRYLGIGGGIGGSEPEVPPPAAASASGASPGRKAMSQEAAIVARQRVRDMDANAHTAVGVIERACKEGADECRSTLESMVDPVIRTADELNVNPEYLVHFPPYSPSSIEHANRLGWTRQNGQWIFGGPQKAGGSTGTLGSYLLSVDECKKLHDRLDEDIQANPGKEPDNLSFFEGECAPQLASYAEDVRNWRARLSAHAPTPSPMEQQAAADTQEDTALLAAAEGDLTQWNEHQLAEERQYEAEIIAAAEERRRKEEEAQHIASSGGVGGRSMGGTSRADFDRTPRYSPVSGPFMVDDVKEYLSAEHRIDDQACGSAFIDARQALARHGLNKSVNLLKGIGYDRVADGKERMELADAVLGALQGCPDSADLRVVRQRYINIYRDGAAYYTKLDPSQSAASSATASADHGYAQCKAKLDSIGTRVSQYSAANSGSASSIMRVVMWADEQAIRIIESTCPSDPTYSAMLADTRKHVADTARSCGQLVSGGHCESMEPD